MASLVYFSSPCDLFVLFFAFQDFSGVSVVKEFACQSRDLGLIPGSEDPLEKEMATDSSILD